MSFKSTLAYLLCLPTLFVCVASSPIDNLKNEKQTNSSSQLKTKMVMSDHSVTVNTEFTSTCTLSNDDFELDNDFMIWPNPTQNKTCFVNFPDDINEVQATVISISGEIVKSLNVNANNKTIYFNGLAAGLYFVTLKSESKEFTTSIIITK